MTAMKVTVDYSAVVQMMPVLECLAKGEMPSDQQIADLLATPGIRGWFHHVQNYGGQLDEDIFRNRLMSAIGKGDLKGRGVDLLRMNMGRVDELRRILDELRRLDLNSLCQEAYAWANRHLTQPFAEPVNLYFMCSTRGSAIVYDQTMVMDIADFEDPAQKPLPVDYILATFAHEIFHMGREKIFSSRPESEVPGRKLIHQLLGMLWEEGIATYLFNHQYSQEQSGWFDAWNNPASTIDKIVELIRLALSENLDEQNVRKSIMNLFGVEGYVLGTRMCQAISDVLGRDGLDRCAASYCVFPSVYNQAVEQGGLDLPKFPQEIVDRLIELDPAK